jgi:four helix bundle protein
MTAISSYRDLDVWNLGIDLVVSCYRITHSFPRQEEYGLSAQLRRAAVSVPSNIAEGHARASTGDYLRHLSIAHGSLAELETHLEIARRLGYLEQTA